jgi:hypothetical protein
MAIDSFSIEADKDWNPPGRLSPVGVKLGCSYRRPTANSQDAIDIRS